jgi:hypothetical protein
MPILDDIMDHPVLGRERKRGMAEEAREIVTRQLQKRFGPLPEWATLRLDSASREEIEAIALRLLDATSLEELLR